MRFLEDRHTLAAAVLVALSTVLVALEGWEVAETVPLTTVRPKTALQIRVVEEVLPEETAPSVVEMVDLE